MQDDLSLAQLCQDACRSRTSEGSLSARVLALNLVEGCRGVVLNQASRRGPSLSYPVTACVGIWSLELKQTPFEALFHKM